MVKGWFILVYVLFGFTLPKDEIQITYLANCGFLYENDSSKVLIDPFGAEFGNFFYLPTAETMFNIIKGNTPFDSINLVLITHIHGDHFNSALAEKFLLKNKQTKMICPPQVYNQMKDSCINFAEIDAQIICPKLSMGNSETITVNNIPITTIRLQHGSGRNLTEIDFNDYTEYEKTENIGYLIEFNHQNIFHQGDACLKINKEALMSLPQKADIAYLSFFDWDSISYQFLKEDLHARYVLFMHGTKPGEEQETEQFKSIKPELIFFEEELESKSFK